MTGLEKIVQQIQQEAGQAAEAVISRAKLEAGQLMAQAKVEAQAQCAAIAVQSVSAVENQNNAAKSAAALATRRAVLTAKQQIISDAITAAQQSVYALPDSDYFALILRMAEKFALPQDGEILFSAADLARLPEGFADALAGVVKNGSLAISRESREIDGGFVLVYGGVEENCSIEALFYAARESLQDKVQELLFS